MSNPTAAMLVIGDEILSGRTRDANMFHLAEQLGQIGIDLKEARVVSDDAEAIIDAVQTLSKRYDNVFTSGGIGPTHDDITADCVAQAFDRPIDVREDARKILAKNYENGEADLTDARLRMARIPDGAELIDNPISYAPGFTVENVHVMAGVPSIFKSMVEGLLPKLATGTVVKSETIRANLPESALAEPLGQIAAEFPDLSIGSYPYFKNGLPAVNIVLRGTDEAMISAATAKVKAAFDL